MAMHNPYNSTDNVPMFHKTDQRPCARCGRRFNLSHHASTAVPDVCRDCKQTDPDYAVPPLDYRRRTTLGGNPRRVG